MQQTVYLVTQTESNIGPEAGTTYTVRVYNENNGLQKTVTGFSTTAWTYLTTDEAAKYPRLYRRLRHAGP